MRHAPQIAIIFLLLIALTACGTSVRGAGSEHGIDRIRIGLPF